VNSAEREKEKNVGIFAQFQFVRDFSRCNAVNICGRDERYYRWQQGSRTLRRSRHIIRVQTIRAEVSRKIRPIPINPRMAIHKYLTVRARRPASETTGGKLASWPPASRIFSYSRAAPDCNGAGREGLMMHPLCISLSLARERERISALTIRSLLKSLTEWIYRPSESN